MMTDSEMWREACRLLRSEGAGVRLYMAERVGQAAGRGDKEAVAEWNAIADRVDAMQEAARKGHH